MFLVGALGVQLRADLGIELAQFGLLSSVYYPSGVVFAVVAGWAAEMLGALPSWLLAVRACTRQVPSPRSASDGVGQRYSCCRW